MPVERLLRPNAAFYLGNKVVDRRGCVETLGDFGRPVLGSEILILNFAGWHS